MIDTLSCDYVEDSIPCGIEIPANHAYTASTPPNKGWGYCLVNGRWKHYCAIHAPYIDDVTIPSELQEIGKQSPITTCFWRLDPDAMLALGAVLAFGEKKYQYENVPLGKENWRLLKHRDHVDHAMEHLVRYLKEVKDGAQPNDEDAGQHLEHAFCRIMFSLATKDKANG